MKHVSRGINSGELAAEKSVSRAHARTSINSLRIGRPWVRSRVGALHMMRTLGERKPKARVEVELIGAWCACKAGALLATRHCSSNWSTGGKAALYLVSAAHVRAHTHIYARVPPVALAQWVTANELSDDWGPSAGRPLVVSAAVLLPATRLLDAATACNSSFILTGFWGWGRFMKSNLAERSLLMFRSLTWIQSWEHTRLRCSREVEGCWLPLSITPISLNWHEFNAWVSFLSSGPYVGAVYAGT